MAFRSPQASNRPSRQANNVLQTELQAYKRSNDYISYRLTGNAPRELCPRRLHTAFRASWCRGFLRRVRLRNDKILGMPLRMRGFRCEQALIR